MCVCVDSVQCSAQFSDAGMKRSKSYTWLSGLLRAKPEEDEWGAAPWVRADVASHDRYDRYLLTYNKRGRKVGYALFFAFFFQMTNY